MTVQHIEHADFPGRSNRVGERVRGMLDRVFSGSQYEVEQVSSFGVRSYERQLCLGQRYLEEGIIDEDQLDQGAVPDNYAAQSISFDVVDHTQPETFTAGARIICPTYGLDSLQAHLKDFPGNLREFIEKTYEDNPDSIAEFGSYTKTHEASPFTLPLIYRAATRYSKKNGIRYWVVGMKPGTEKGYEKYAASALLDNSHTPARFGEFRKPFYANVIDVDQLDKIFDRSLGATALTKAS